MPGSGSAQEVGWLSSLNLVAAQQQLHQPGRRRSQRIMGLE